MTIRLDIYLLIQNNEITKEQMAYIAAILGIEPHYENPEIFKSEIIRQMYLCISEKRLAECLEFLNISIQNRK